MNAGTVRVHALHAVHQALTATQHVDPLPSQVLMILVRLLSLSVYCR